MIRVLVIREVYRLGPSSINTNALLCSLGVCLRESRHGTRFDYARQSYWVMPKRLRSGLLWSRMTGVQWQEPPLDETRLPSRPTPSEGSPVRTGRPHQPQISGGTSDGDGLFLLRMYPNRSRP